LNRKLNILVFLIFISNVLSSQDNEIGFFFGGTNYIGDVGPTTYVNPFLVKNSVDNGKSSFTTAVGILYRKNFSNRFGLRLGLNIADIESSDLWNGSKNYRIERGKSFKNNLQEFHVGIDFNFLEFETSSNDFDWMKSCLLSLSIFFLALIINSE